MLTRNFIQGFYEDGGWKFLNMQGSDEEDEEDPEDAESDFEPSGSEEVRSLCSSLACSRMLDSLLCTCM